MAEGLPLGKLLHRICVTDGKHFRLRDYATDTTRGLGKHDGEALVHRHVGRLAGLQERLYAQSTHALLCVFQAMDAAGKDGTIKHVMSGVNPQGVQVTSFKAPGPTERAHDFLWRVHAAAPLRGNIGIFNRSHYEDVLIARVHPEQLGLGADDPGEKFWRHRLDDIAAFERHMVREGTLVLKFFLYISKEEQKRRFLERLDDPSRHWKFSDADLVARRSWGAYMDAYEAAIAATATRHAPWFVIPADHKWLAHLLVAEAIIAALEELDPQIPATPAARAMAIAEARRELLAEAD
jgi:PPK2 family polyphosphate:nucleotide phosphotransferase